MRARKTLWITSLAVLGLLTPVVLGGAPMGLPTSIPDKGRWAFGIEYGHEEADLEASGFGVVVAGGISDFDLEDFESDMFFGTFAYGISDHWDIFLRLGAADAQARMDSLLRPLFGDVDSSAEFAGGVGTRASLWRRGPWTLGGLAQVTWFNPAGRESTFLLTPEQPDGITSISEKVDLKYWQAQVSLSAIYQAEAWRFWAGPFLQIMEGEVDLERQVIGGASGGSLIDASGDLEDEVRVGGHFGVLWQLADRWNLWLEGQAAEDSWLIGLGAAFLP